MQEEESHNFIEHEERHESVWARIGRPVAAVILIFGLIYFYVGRQLFFYKRTAPSITQPEIKSQIDAELVTLPIKVIVFESTGEDGSSRSDENIKNLIDNSSNIWSQANIEIRAQSIERQVLTDETISQFVRSPADFVLANKLNDPNKITVFLVRHLGGINGVAVEGLKIFSVADITTTYDFRIFAHELGHVLGLKHVSPRGQLMHQGTNGVDLLLEEIISARMAAERLALQSAK